MYNLTREISFLDIYIYMLFSVSLDQRLQPDSTSNPFRVFFAEGILMRTSHKPCGRGVNLFVPSLFSSVCALREGGRSKQKEKETEKEGEGGRGTNADGGGG